MIVVCVPCRTAVAGPLRLLASRAPALCRAGNRVAAPNTVVANKHMGQAAKGDVRMPLPGCTSQDSNSREASPGSSYAGSDVSDAGTQSAAESTKVPSIPAVE
jgi:hypothetical protein